MVSNPYEWSRQTGKPKNKDRVKPPGRAAGKSELVEAYTSLIALCSQEDATVSGIRAVIECRLAALLKEGKEK